MSFGVSGAAGGPRTTLRKHHWARQGNAHKDGDASNTAKAGDREPLPDKTDKRKLKAKLKAKKKERAMKDLLSLLDTKHACGSRAKHLSDETAWKVRSSQGVY